MAPSPLLIPVYAPPPGATLEDLAYIEERQGKPDVLDSIQNICYLFGTTAALHTLDGVALFETVDASGNCALSPPLPPIGAIIEVFVIARIKT